MTEKIRLDQRLVDLGLAPSRARAREAILAGGVFVDGVQADKPGRFVLADARIEAEPAHPWASRGGVKLVAGLDAFGIDPRGRTCLDLGASTGGFVDVLLARGANRVYAVDVGSDQLAARLRADPRVTSWERTDARSLSADRFSEPISLVVADVSFIALVKAIGPALTLVAEDADLVALIKPQFELGPDALDKRGHVRGEDGLDRAVAKVCAELDAIGWRALKNIESPIRGGGGAREGLVHARRV